MNIVVDENESNDCADDDILDVLPIIEYPKIKSLLKIDWPLYRMLYYWVEEAIQWKTKDPGILIDIYYPKGKIESNIFIGISDLSYQVVVPLSFGGTVDLLKEVCMKTQRISWHNKNFQIITALLTPLNTILIEMQHLQIVPILSYYPHNIWAKSASDCIKEDVIVPNGCYLSEITEDHVDFIHSHWPHRRLDHPEFTLGTLTMRIKMNKGIGLFSKSDDELKSWILLSEFGTLSVLHTVEKHRQKGYAQIVTKQMAKVVALEKKHDSIATIVPGNKTSENLFKKLNYTLVQTATWISRSATNYKK